MLIMGKETLVYLKWRKLQLNSPQIYSQLANRNIVTISINLKDSSLTQF